MGSGSGCKSAANWVASIVSLSLFIVVYSLYIAKLDHPLSSSSSSSSSRFGDCFSLPSEVADSDDYYPMAAAIPSTRKMLMMMGVPKARAAGANNNNNNNNEEDYSSDQSRHHYPNNNNNNNNNNQVAGVQLRNVPSGPDPLHHNEAPQRRPRRPITP